MDRPMEKPQRGVLRSPIAWLLGCDGVNDGLKRMVDEAKAPLAGLAAMPTITQGLA